jgi:hypothetical protein
MAEVDKDLQKAIDDHLKRLYEHYKSNNKVFTATHIGHISLAVIFVLSILFPFLYLQIDSRETDSELERMSQDIAQQEQRAAVYHRTMMGLKKVFEAVENTPKPLGGYIQALEKEAAGGAAAAMPDGLKPPSESCGAPSDKDPWMECRIRQYMAARAAQYQEILADEIAAPLEKLNIKEFDQWKAELQAGMKSYAERLRSEMDANPRFWRDFNQDAPIYRNMIEGVHRFWADHHFEEIGRRMEQASAERRSAIEQLNQKKEQIQKSKEGLNNALKNIKTRFGKLGLEVDDAILLAPVAFSALFLVAALNLCKNIQLRKSFHRLFQARDPGKLVLTDSEIALAMPLWVDPLAPPVQRKLKLAVLMIPALASISTLLVVFYCWTIPAAFPGMGGLDYVKYTVYYLIAAGLFLYGFQRIQGAVKSYGSLSPAEQTLAESS